MSFEDSGAIHYTTEPYFLFTTIYATKEVCNEVPSLCSILCTHDFGNFLRVLFVISSGRNLLKAANLYTDEEGNENNLTITRKTYICWGLINDENIFDIAKNCGNSSEVIEKYYANKLTSVQLEDRLHKIYKSGLSIIK